MINCDISIVVSTLNVGAYIEETLESLLKAVNYDKSISSEIIIVDGKSVDTTMEKVKNFSEKVDRGLICCVSRKDSSGAEALNDGFAMASGKNLTFCDGDDLFAPEALSVFVNMLNKFEVVVGEKEGFKVENGKKMVTFTKKTSMRPFLKLITKEKKDSCLLHSQIASPPLAFTKKRFEEVGPIDEKMKAAYDYDLALKLIYSKKICPPGYTDKVLVYYRQRPDSTTNRYREKQRREGETALNSTFKRIGLKGIKAVHMGRVYPGYLYWEHQEI